MIAKEKLIQKTYTKKRNMMHEPFEHETQKHRSKKILAKEQPQNPHKTTTNPKQKKRTIL
jgi:hypothetical protein